MKLSKKALALMMAMVMVFGGVVGGTVAWLTATTTDVVNTFTVGNINIELKETDSNQDGDGNVNTNSYKMVPGSEIEKDPKVTVKANSEACWLFVKVQESANYDDFMAYEMADGWTALPGVEGVYYREHDAVGNADASAISILKEDKVTVKNTVTKTMMDTLTDTTLPKLTFTAYAVQKANINTVQDAWETMSPTP